MSQRAKNIVERLSDLSESSPSRVALRFLGDGTNVTDTLSFAELHRRARGVAACLQRLAKPGERALLLFPTGIPYVDGFLGCLYAGVIAVPAYPPESAQPQHLKRLASILSDASPSVVLTESRYVEPLRAFLGLLGASPSLTIFATDSDEANSGGDYQSPELRDDSVAFLQYTSGSTATPKGVMVSHGNLVANERAIQQGFGVSERDTIVTWLPLYHDMGLIGGLLQPLFSGAELVLMSPRHFLERPARWLEAIARFGGTVSGAPDFAYRLCTERIADEASLAALDLSLWRVAFSGSEPVRDSTLRDFAARFGAFGFDENALYACYGLAEATLFVTGGEPGSGLSRAHFDRRALALGQAREVEHGGTLVSCGHPRREHGVLIVDPESQEAVAPGQIGEIWISGPSLALGYWNNEPATRETFVAREGSRYLRTGDLGFMRADELFVSGRIKDMIIVRGQNLYPQDIERSVEEEVELVRKGRVAAFAVEEDGVEGIGVAAEVSRSVQKLVQPEALVAAICEAVARAQQESPQVVLLLSPGGLPKTSSGKLQRNGCKQAWQAGELDVIAELRGGQIRVKGQETAASEGPPPSPREEQVASIWRDVLGAPHVKAGDSFFALGGSSLKAALITARVAAELGVELSPAVLWETPTLRAFVARLPDPGSTSREAIRPRVEQGELLPLSHSQQRFWLLHALRPESAAYNVQVAVRLVGALESSALERACRALIRRHPALRTCFVTDAAERIWQRVLDEREPSLRAVDVSVAGGERQRQEAVVQRAAEADGLRPFDLGQEPLVRVLFAEIEPTLHLLVVTFHHIVTDGVSVQICLQELPALCQAEMSGTTAELPRLSIDYADYALWQRAELERAEVTQRLALLCRAQPSEPKVLRLPTRGQRSPVASQRGGSVHFEIEAETERGVAALAAAHGLTPFMVLLGAWSALLYRYTGESELSIGVPVANRTRPGTERVVGPFVNTVVARPRVQGEHSFLQLLAQVRLEALRIQIDQDLPLEKVLDAAGARHGASDFAPFQVMFNHQRVEGAPASREGLTLELLHWDLPVTQFELVLDTYEQENAALRARFGYDADLFERSTIERLRDHFLSLLASLVAQPQRPLGEIRLGEASNGESLTRRATTAIGSVRLVLAEFDAAMARRPERDAVVAGEERLSYAKLDAFARRVALRLRELGVAREARVGISAGRAPHVIAAMLGVWKAGGSYVPLDPEYPADRIHYMLDDARVRVLLTERCVLARLTVPKGVQCVCLEDLDTGPELECDSELVPEQLAYVIYTSGSTGNPKGVSVSQGALAMHCAAAAALYEMKESDRALHFASMSFDAAVEQWVVPLVFGGGVVLSQGLWTGAETAAIVEREGVTVVYPPTSYVTELARFASEQNKKLQLRVCTVGGEAVSRESVELIRRGLDPAWLVNGYGPTEAVVTPLLWRAAAGAGFSSNYAPIGDVVGDRSAWVLDADLQRVPAGVVGELYLGGSGLARGYHARSALTAERFVPDPFSASGGRLYRTGDLARQLDDGSFEYIGRTDRQIKIRGYRVELEEIEAALLAQAEVREAAVLVSERHGKKRLVGYAAGSFGDRDDSVESIRRGLAARLPEHMVPSQFVLLEELPRTPNGKVDRKRLPEPSATDAVRRAPRTELEAKLVALWRGVLGVEALGIDDDFFALGGDSIQVIQLVGRARKAGLDFAPRDLFAQATVLRLAELIEQRADAGAESATHIAGSEDTTGEVPLTPIQLDFFERPFGSRNHFNQAVLLELTASIPPTKLEQALNALVHHHDAFRLRFETSGAEVRQYYGASAVAPVLSVHSVEDVSEARVLAELAQRSLDLTLGALLRAVLIRAHDGTERLLLIAHHSVVDGVSWRILLEDLEALLLAPESEAKFALPAKTASFGAWSKRLTALGESDALEADVASWEAKVGAAALQRATPAASCDVPPQLITHRFSPALSAGLLEAARSGRGRTLEVLLVALAGALAAKTGRASVLIELEGHGREERELSLDVSRTVGWFTTLLPLILRARETPSETLHQVRRELADLPTFGLRLGAARRFGVLPLRERLRALPAPELVFNYLGSVDQSLAQSQLFRAGDGPLGELVDPSAPLPAPVVLDTRVSRGCLQCELYFDSRLCSRTDAERLLQTFESKLGEAVRELAEAPRRLSPEDFPAASLKQAELDALPVAHSRIEAIAPLTPVQEGILFHAVESGTEDPYFFQRGFALEGNWDLARLERAWKKVAARHATLRSAYFWDVASRALRVTLREPALDWSFDDWSHESEAVAQGRLAQLLEVERATPFDFGNAARLRLRAIRVRTDLYWLFWSHHHIALDGWSMALVVAEVLQHYRALSSEQALPVGHSCGYEEYVAWVANRDALPSLDYFKKQLAGFDAPTPLAVGVPSGNRSYAQSSRRLSADLVERLRAAAQQLGVTLNTAIQAAWGLALARRAGVRDVVFGVTVSGRSAELEGIEQMVGLFINTLPLRARFTPELRVRDWLRALQVEGAELREHEATPLLAVQRASELQDGQRLFESILVVENYPIERALSDQPAPPRLRLIEDTLPAGTLSVARGRNNYPLSLIVTLHDEVAITLSHRLDCLDEAAGVELRDQVCALLEALLEHPEQPLGDVGLAVAPGEALLSAPAAGSEPVDVISAWRASVARTPRDIALQCGGVCLSYAEADAWSERLAHALVANRVGSESRIAIALERSVEFVVAVLGVLKAGAAYVPLDLQLPKERLEFLLSDSTAQLLVTSRTQAVSALSEGLGRCFIEDYVSGAPVAAPARALHPQQAAYLIYTSGSTGQPKGVVVPHGAIAGYVAALLARLRLPPRAGMAMASTVAADLGHTVLFAALCSQRALHLVPPEHGFDADSFARTMQESGAAVLKIVPSHLAALLRAGRARDTLPGHTLILGGEACAPELLQTIHGLAPELRVVNHYGPTETTVGVLTHEIRVFNGSAPPPLGFPLPGSRAYVLDGDLNPVPPGVPGELYVAGTGVARGYQQRAGLTAERFVPDLLAPGERMYRTGDRVVVRAGLLEFLGRNDDQVKIRGNRVELGEVTNALRSLSGVLDACVTALPNEATGQLELVGYYVANAEEGSNGSRLAAELERGLPGYMLPRLVQLAQIPLTANGKVDKRRLPKPEATTRSYVAPQTTLEQALAEVWQSVLRVERVGVHDNFFELGGDSILSLQVIARAKRRQIRISPKLIFAEPTLSGLAAALEREQGSASLLGIVRADRKLALPLSSSQQRLWFLSQLAPASRAYTVAGAIRLRGGLDESALARAIEALGERHEILRTRFIERDGRVEQRIDSAFQSPLARVDCPVSRVDDPRFLELLDVELERAFELAEGPLFRATLVRLAERDFVLLCVAHHIIVDGWSMNVLVDELAALYAAVPSLVPPALQFADYAAFEQAQLGSEEAQNELRHWTTRLGAAPAVLELPLDRPRPAAASFRGDVVPCDFASPHVEQLRRYAERRQATPFMVLLAAFALTLHRYSSEPRMRIGVPNANRFRPETQALIGPLVNTQVFQLDLAPTSSFDQLLEQVKAVAVDAQAHQTLPFERLVEALRPERSLAHSPLFQVMFNHQKRDLAPLRQLPGLDVTRVELQRHTAQIDLLFATEEDETGALRGSFGYATDLFERATIATFGEHFQRLLAAALAEPARPLALLPMLSTEETALARAWNATETAFGLDGSVADWVARVALGRPQEVALVFRGRTLSYAELDRRANQLAQRLVHLSVGPDVVVGIALERSFELVIAILAVLKAGGAFLPLDLEYPRQRLALLIGDSGAAVVISATRHLEQISGTGVGRVVCMDTERFEDAPNAAPRPNLAPENLAYVIYTSGSTGKPKGVGNSHRGLKNRLLWMQEAYRLGEADVVLQKTPATFDVSVWEFLWPLMTGAQLVLAEPGEHRDPARLAALIVERGVTTLHFVPSMLAAFLEEPGARRCTSIVRVIASGEALSAELARRFASRLPDAELVNLYGPTEAAIDVTHFTCSGQDEVVPIGYPIANTTVHVLDPALNPLPRGVAGELYLGGVGLARGYCGRAALTAERFVPDPSDGAPGARLYRTGDRVRRRSDGALEYLGRLDHQVKLRGFRIELGEVEASLRERPGVRDAVAVVRADTGVDPRLVAYVTWDGPSRTSEELRGELSALLPEHLVPSLVMSLAELPVTSNGKLNRSALPLPEWQRAVHEPPKNELEQTVADIWQEVLGLERVGRRDDFFALGGHSLLAVKVISRLRERCGFAPPLRALFEASNVERLALVLAAESGKSSDVLEIDSILTELEAS